MKKTLSIRIFITLFTILFNIDAYGHETTVAADLADSLEVMRYRQRKIRLTDRIVPLLDMKTPANEVESLVILSFWLFHPATDSLPESAMREITARKHFLGKDSLLTADLFWVLKPYRLWLHNLDPHFVFQSYATPDTSKIKWKQAFKQIREPALRLLNINDTLIVEQSLDPLFKRGDQILAINDIPATQYLEYSYEFRYHSPLILLNNYYFNLTADFNVSVVRDGVKLELTTHGMPYEKAEFKLIKQREFVSRIFPEAQAGYFAIEEFYPINTVLIKKLRKSILQFKAKGCYSVILDLRGNPGGNGSQFDQLLSIFINKPSIPYLKNQWLRVSYKTQHDYDFITDSMKKQLVRLPDEEIVKEIMLDTNMYIEGMKYYVLMNKDTGSIAASFCNILQYNDAAKLVGEPLLHNAIKYGDGIDLGTLGENYLGVGPISTIEYDEYTKAIDGIIMPDISIPYVAADYLSGKDAMLEKLLDMIKLENVN